MIQPSMQRKPSRSSGFTVVEVVVALTIASIGLLGLSSAMATGAKLQGRTEQFAAASRAARLVHERMHGGDLDARFDEFQAAPTLEIDSLRVTVTFPEQVLIDAIGGPVPAQWRYRDTDLDGEVERDDDASSRASLVPVAVEVTWQGGELRTFFLVTER